MIACAQIERERGARRREYQTLTPSHKGQMDQPGQSHTRGRYAQHLHQRDGAFNRERNVSSPVLTAVAQPTAMYAGKKSHCGGRAGPMPNESNETTDHIWLNVNHSKNQKRFLFTNEII